ncbi:MAG: hypothetical protein AAGJ46_13285 [Planctomycetota bacterium]
MLATLTIALQAVGAEPAVFAPPQDGWRPLGTHDRKVVREPSRPESKNRLVMIHRDGEVRPAAFGEGQRSGGVSRLKLAYRQPAKTRSVVTRRTSEVAIRPMQVAQAGEPDFGAELKRQMEEPFGGGPGEPLPPPMEDDAPIEDPLQDAPLPDFGDPAGDEGPAIEVPPMGDLPGGFEPDGRTLPPVDPPADDSSLPAAPEPQPQIVDEQPMEPIEDPLRDAPFDNNLEDLGDFGDDDLGDMDLGDDDAELDEATKEANRRTEAYERCAEELAELKANRLAMIDITIGVTGRAGTDYPFNCSIDDGTPYAPRCWQEVVYMWKASGLCHKPLYFEQVGLERYGHSWGPHLDPVLSGVHFFGRIPALPFMMGLQAPNECVYTLGHYRPGNCAPYLLDPLPMTGRAAAWEAAAWTGGIFLVP